MFCDFRVAGHFDFFIDNIDNNCLCFVFAHDDAHQQAVQEENAAEYAGGDYRLIYYAVATGSHDDSECNYCTCVEQQGQTHRHGDDPLLLGRANDLVRNSVTESELSAIVYSFEDSPDEEGDSCTKRQNNAQKEWAEVIESVLELYQIRTQSPRSRHQEDGRIDAANPSRAATGFAAGRDNAFFDLQFFDTVPETSRNELVDGKEKRRDNNNCKLAYFIKLNPDSGDQMCW